MKRLSSIVLVGGLVFGVIQNSACAQESGAYISPEESGGYAIDAKGVRHDEPFSSKEISPVYKDCIRSGRA